MTISYRTLTASFALLLSTYATADVTLKQRVTIDGNGGADAMDAEGTVTTQISGKHSRSDNQVELKNSMMQRFARNANTASIVRLDDEKIITLIPEKQEYSEMTFAEMQAQMERSMQAMEDLQGSGGGGGALPVSDDECQWSDPVMRIESSRDSIRVAGVKARWSGIFASQTCTVPSTGKTCIMKWNLEYWNAKRMPGDDEVLAFQRDMAEAMGGEEMLSLAKTSYAGLLAMFKNGWDEVLEESEAFEGFPVKTVMSMDIGGEECTMDSGEPITMDEVWSNAANAGVQAAGSTAAYHAGSAAGQAAGEAVGGGVGGSIAGSALGSASRELASGMFKKFGNRKKEEEQVQATDAPPNPATDTVRIFTIATELISVSDDDIAPGRFEAPVNWKKTPPPTY